MSFSFQKIHLLNTHLVINLRKYTKVYIDLHKCLHISNKIYIN